MTATRVDDLLLALYGKAVAAQPTTLAGVTVVDGPWPAAYVVTDLDFLVVGGDFEPANASVSAVQTTQTPDPMGNASMDEALTVRCVVVSQAGDTDMAARRARAVTVLEAYEDLLTADQTLGGLLQESVTLSVDSVRQVQTAKGAYCAINFTIGASALIWNG